MKQIILFVHIFGLAVSAKLDNTYLPPPNARSASGNHLVDAPFHGIAINPRRYGTPNGFSTPEQPHQNAHIPHSQRTLTNIPKYTSGTGIQGHDNFGNPNAGFGRPSYTHGRDNILRYNNQNNGDGSYEFDFETENQISQNEVGRLENAGTDRESSVVQGGYSYVAPNGQKVAVNYVADENGFRTNADGAPQSSTYSQNLFRHNGYGNRGHASHAETAPHLGRFGSQNLPFSRQHTVDHSSLLSPSGSPNDFQQHGTVNTHLRHQSDPDLHQIGSQIGLTPFGRQNLRTLGHHDGFNQGVASGLRRQPQLGRQYLPPGNSVHTGY